MSEPPQIVPANTSNERHVVTKQVDTRWLFNNFYVGVMVIDCRSAHQVAENTLLGAIHIPPMEKCHTMSDFDAQLLAPHQESFALSRRKLRDVVLVGDGSEESIAWLQCVKQLLVCEGAVAGVSTLTDTFESFYEHYPFYTTKYRSASTKAVRRTYPNEILDQFLYLGNMWQAESEQVIQDLGITHVVNATLDLGNVFERRGVRYFEVKIPDQNDADISSYFDETFEFIDNARAIHTPTKPAHRVLVHCTQGISRSATLVLMYLMRANRWSLVTAFNAAHRSRPVIIPNNGFFQMLMEEERRLFEGKNSLHEREIDELLQGRLGDREPTILDVDATTRARKPRPVSANKCTCM